MKGSSVPISANSFISQVLGPPPLDSLKVRPPAWGYSFPPCWYTPLNESSGIAGIIALSYEGVYVSTSSSNLWLPIFIFRTMTSLASQIS